MSVQIQPLYLQHKYLAHGWLDLQMLELQIPRANSSPSEGVGLASITYFCSPLSLPYPTKYLNSSTLYSRIPFRVFLPCEIICLESPVGQRHAQPQVKDYQDYLLRCQDSPEGHQGFEGKYLEKTHNGAKTPERG